jgi:hypothetical protein
MLEDSQLVKESEEVIPELYKDIKFTDDQKRVWYPTVINIHDKGTVFVNGSNKDNWGWAGIKAIETTDEEKDKFKGATHKSDPTTLKMLLSLSADHFDDIDYCPITTNIINSLSEYESVKYWKPTLVCKNGNFYVVAINEVLNDIIKDIPLTNDLVMVADYVQYGIDVSDSVIEHFLDTEDPMKITLAVSYRVECEVRDLTNAIKWLRELGCDSISTHASKKSIISDLVEEASIDLINDRSDLSIYNKPVMIHYRNYGFAEPLPSAFKLIKCVNSEPINLGDK